MRATRFIPLALSAAFLLGCGQKGALYLPEEKPETVAPQAPPSTPPATDTPTESAPHAPAENQPPVEEKSGKSGSEK